MYKLISIFAFICLSIQLTNGQVGIGTSTPQAELHVAGSKTGIQTLRIDDLAVTPTGTNPGELPSTSATTKKTIYIDDSGNLWSSDAYGSNMKSTVLSATQQNIMGTTLVDITGASITFTPKHPMVYVSFVISGYNPLDCVNGSDQLGWFKVALLKDASIVGNFVSLSATSDDVNGAAGASTITIANFPVAATPNVPMTLKLQGSNGGVNFDCGFTIDAINYTSYLSIMD